MEMFHKSTLASVVTLSMAFAGSAYAAGNNNGPPSGAILDLNGTPIPHTTTPYTIDFTASLSSTSVSFAFREDPAFLLLSTVSVVDLTTSSGNLLTNGNFSGGVHTDPVTGNMGVPNGWTYQNTFAATFSGFVSSSSASGGNCGGLANCWYDGSVQAYDAISQSINTHIGDVYQISFDLSDNGTLTTFSRLSTNGDTTDTGGNGADVLVYAQASAVQPGVPEPGTWAMMLLGFAGLGFAFRQSRRKVTFA
jgi:PEP-CTERM motif